ncbi:MAG: hypothetical protein AB2A00_38885 [Myxococcota bacterium]
MLRGVLWRMGGILVRPVRTLLSILHDGEGDPLEPILLSILVVAAAFPMTVARYALAAEVSVAVALSRLFSANGFVWMRLVNELIFCAIAAAGFYLVALLSRRRTTAGNAITAGLYLYVPMAALTLLGVLLTRAGLKLPWLPNHPLDGWWVYEGNRFHPERVVLKLVVEMAWPTVIGLGAAWRTWRSRPSSAATGNP